ncbi:flagellar filament capping protein FliD [Clostridium sp. MSJ-8]|uniref:flagellar filament capping protein FliD n=1 Tax=Clostridium sp. MSJ-8 TaxID=2841510 RepID=UPI001C0F12F5|nr:flagellar filament capping protein FliD [Clostridium sp. MSJ-8]MBU5488436.1 flagellar filament capping protein FliD [Clostridium sp. MSJ-8]
MASSSNRITGLATGMDIDSIVEASLATYKSKITKKTQEKEILEIKQQLYRDIISEGRNLYDKYFDMAKSKNLLNSSLYSSVSCTSSNEYSIIATSGASAVKGNYTVEVKSEGTKSNMELTNDELTGDMNINIKGTNIIIRNDELTNSDGTQKSDKEKADIINDKIKAYGLSAYTTDFNKGKIIIEANEFGDNSFSITKGVYKPEQFTELSQGTLTSNTDGYSVATLDVSMLLNNNQDLEFKYGDKTIRVKSEEIKNSVKSLDEEIESVQNDNVLDQSAKDEKIKQLGEEKARIVTSTISGKLAAAGFSTELPKDSNGDVNDYSKINIQIKENDTLTLAEKKFTYSYGTITDEYVDTTGNSAINSSVGGKASVVVNGPRGEITINEAGKTFTLDGITFDISSAKANDKVTISARTDVSAAKETITNFINDYNSFVEKLNTLLTEKKYRNYAPLTDDQKKEMTEKEVSLWEEKVKSGQLRNDGDLSRIVTNMRSAMTSTVSGSSSYLEQIGITVSSDYGGTKSGTFTVDEEKLTAALENNMEDVMKLFAQVPDSSATGTDKYNQQGIAYRLKDILYNEFESSSKSALIQKAGYTGTRYFTQNTLSTSISQYETLISQLNSQLSDKEQALYTKWASIEKAMNSYNSQMESLSSMFGGSSS